ncbi:MAG TPA: Nif3-like dinuclear metal center hexameric protein [Steroidobacteraceae bacterium]|nr:Nif3-like dinuclear metal center hexameric protein [Steroidobacteraceae bacterium]
MCARAPTRAGQLRRLNGFAVAIALTTFANGLSAETANAAGAQSSKPTAREVIAAIQHEIPGNWDTPTVDTFKAGNPDTVVTGIAVTMMATMDVLQRAAAQGDNLIITHEPVFFDHMDTPQGIDESDAVWREKREFIARHELVIWRFHDHWHQRKPDGIQSGMTRVLGWAKYQDPQNPHLFKLPPTTLRELAEEVSRKLQRPILRIVGDPGMPVSVVVMSPGAAGFARHAAALEAKEVDVLLAGEAHEWETVEYAADAVSQGRKKALILIGHVPSEQAGMEDCAQWLKTFIKGVPVEFVATLQPFWTTTDYSPPH